MTPLGDKAKLEDDPRFPYGLPNPDNGNYLWIQIFASALNARWSGGRSKVVRRAHRTLIPFRCRVTPHASGPVLAVAGDQDCSAAMRSSSGGCDEKSLRTPTALLARMPNAAISSGS